MKYEIEKLKDSVKINFTVPVAEWNEEMNAAYLKTKGKYNIPGFRKGHAPRKVIENAYGASVFFDDAFNSAASKGYSKALTENLEIFPVDEPKVDIQDFNETEMKFSMTVVVKPEVKLGQYKGIKIPKVEYNVTKADVDAELESALVKASREVNVTDRVVANGDIVILDYSGSVDNVKFNGGTAEKQTLIIGSNSFIPGFEDQMVGMNIGETKDLNVKFPDEYQAEELKGKNAVFTVTVHEIKVKEKPKADDEFAKDTSKFETLKDYIADIEARLKKTNEHKAEVENKNKMVETVCESFEVEIPQCMIDSELDYMLSDFEYRLSYMYQGMKLDDYFKYTGSSRDDFKKERAEDAKKAVKTRLALESIIKEEKIEPSEQDVDAKLTEVAASANKSLEEYKKQVNKEQLSYIKNDILMNKVLEFLTNANTFELTTSEKTPTKKTAAKPKK